MIDLWSLFSKTWYLLTSGAGGCEYAGRHTKTFGVHSLPPGIYLHEVQEDDWTGGDFRGKGLQAETEKWCHYNKHIIVVQLSFMHYFGTLVLLDSISVIDFLTLQSMCLCLCSVFRCCTCGIAFFPSWSERITSCVNAFLQWPTPWTQCTHFWCMILKMWSPKPHLDPSLIRHKMQKRWSPHWITCVLMCTVSAQSWNNLIGIVKT